jgi:hypothetical protein
MSDVATKGTDDKTPLPIGPEPFGTKMHNRWEEPDALICLSFEERFFALPGDLQACIIANSLFLIFYTSN